MAFVSSKEFLDIQIDIECGFTLKHIRDMIKTYNYSDNYSKISGSLWKYYRDEANNNLTDSELFKSKIKIMVIQKKLK